MRRREFLAVAGLSATVSTAGCLDSVLGRERRLARVGLSNFADESHRFDLRVARDDETVHESTHEVRGASDDRIFGTAPDCDWGTTPGDYEVFARVDGGEWASRSASEIGERWDDSASCVSAHVQYGDSLWIDIRGDCDELFTVSPETCLVGDETTL
ncbi:hypothetical protein [Salinirubrum litoreum]|uniref:Uncharacterized protein n=1 Tax=Salinirubrum litoreum TaxID=1126234 RepID=A0ABD5R7B9_9EURY|nr:hypothetical protein [Salinirubrum litoreum]